MDATLVDKEFDKWFSTYGMITSERILRHYKINFSASELLTAIKTPTSFYRKLLQVPLKNVLVGIILQQANDYHLYTQKLFIDYLLSGESSKPEEAQGASTREQIEEQRKLLVALGEEFNQFQFEHEAFISRSQKKLIEFTTLLHKQLNTLGSTLYNVLSKTIPDLTITQIKNTIVYSLMHHGLFVAEEEGTKKEFMQLLNKQLNTSPNELLQKEMEFVLSSFFVLLSQNQPHINELLNQTQDMIATARNYRTQFYNSALKTLELIRMLPDYKINEEQDIINRQHLYFDKTIGEVQ